MNTRKHTSQIRLASFALLAIDAAILKQAVQWGDIGAAFVALCLACCAMGLLVMPEANRFRRE